MIAHVINEVNSSFKGISNYKNQNPEKVMIMIIAAIGVLGTFYLFQYDASSMGLASLDQTVSLASR